MTERTFRDPSPSRVNSEHHYRDDPPPVPALPKGYTSSPPVPARSLQRPASVEPPERVTSPVPRAGGRGVSLDRGPGFIKGKQTKRTKVPAPALGTVGETERAQNRESINFSRPMSPLNSSPTAPFRETNAFPGLSQYHTQTPTANMSVLRDGEADNIQYAIQDSATRPVKKKKKAVAKQLVEGSHFPKEGGERPSATVLDTPKRAPLSASSTPSPSDSKTLANKPTAASQPAAKKKKKRVVSSESSQGSYPSDSDSAMSDRSNSTDRPRSFTTRAAGLLAKQPSIVREDREAEEQENYGEPAQHNNPNGSRFGRASVAPTSAISTTTKQHKKSASQPPNISSTFDNSHRMDISGASGEPTGSKNVDSLTTKQPRLQSLSPGRAAHFLAQPTYEASDGIRHQPPARSVSPAKSALKHSPSSRGASPVGSAAGGSSRLPGAAGSEASDNGSTVSDDGGRLQPRKKKSVRVSFDEGPINVGHASTPPASESPTILSPQHKDSARKGFLGFGRRNEAGGLSHADQEDAMEPTPALPSFGSIRGRNQGEAGSVSTRVDERNAIQTPGTEAQSSSDQVVGHVLSQDFLSRRNAPVEVTPSRKVTNDPLPPEVTSVEGSGYHSDDEESTQSENEDVRRLPGITAGLPTSQQRTVGAEPTVPKHSASEDIDRGEDESSVIQNGVVPTIAILPATPGIGSSEQEQEDWFKMPGGFSAAAEDQGDQSSPSLRNGAGAISAPTAIHHPTDPTPAKLGISEPEPESTTTSPAGSPIVGHVAESIQHQTEASNEEESDDTGNSIYSDAAEDIADLEGDGFGSINAIIESPVIPRTPFVASLVPESLTAPASSSSAQTARPKTVTRKESELSEPPAEEGWDQAQAYWSGLSQSRKEQLERAAQGSGAPKSSAKMNAATAPMPVPALAPEEKTKKKKAVKRAPQSTNPPLPPWPDREFRQEVTRPASPNDGKMKQSMRSPQPDAPQTHMRASMRNGVPLKSSMRNSAQISDTQPVPRGGLTKRSRPVSAVVTTDYGKVNGKAAASHERAASVGVTPKTAAPVPMPNKVIKPALRRATSNGSDSSSSFKKSRPSTSGGDKYSMKRTMRGASIDGRPQSAYANKPPSSSTRSPSPTARRPFSTAGSGMRTSMRDSMDSGLESRTKSPSRGFAFGRKSEPKAAPKKTGSRFSSRFGDSSDEDEAPTKRRSRFVDSSDEEDDAGLTPVRGIPRRIDEGDSTDLEDSSASPSPLIQTKDNKPSVSATKPVEGSALTTGSLRAGQGTQSTEKEKKKRSFFGGLGGSKKQSHPPPIDTTLSPASLSHPLEANYASPQPSSTPRSPKAAKFLGNNVTTSPNPSQASPKSPKLQRRNTPKRFASDSWPLPENNTSPAFTMATNEKMRPSTSDGAGVGKPLAMGTMRPETGARRFTAEGQPIGLGVNGMVGGGGKEAKKKRFPMLRKALGIKSSS